MLSTRMNIAKNLIARGVKKGEHPYVTEYYDRIAAAKAEKEAADKAQKEKQKRQRGK